MHVHLLAVGTGMPSWVRDGYHDYAARLSGRWKLELKEIKVSKAGSAAKRVQEEGERLLAAVPRGARIVCLDEGGRQETTVDTAARWQRWQEQHGQVALLVGGADGLSAACLDKAAEHWSLSALTLPHMLVRVLVAEQVYRIVAVLAGHPYHREGKA